MREKFLSIAFRRKTVALIEQANEIINEMQAKGYTLTIRQLYYQFVARGLLENRQTNYQRLASVIDDARKAGLVDWDAIEDRTRYLRRVRDYSGPQPFLSSMARSYYAENLWEDQEHYCEVWIEKDALLGVIENACLEWRVPYFACRGYASSSELYTAGKRLRSMKDLGKEVTVFHLGDHDPSGLDMTRVNEDSLQTFGRSYGITVERLALNMNQIEQYDPPPNPAKESDSRFEEYARQYGDESWELDALDPDVIDRLIRDAIEGIVDAELFDQAQLRESANKELIMQISRKWDNVSRYMKYNDTEVEAAEVYPITADKVLEAAANHEEDDDEPGED